MHPVDTSKKLELFTSLSRSFNNSKAHTMNLVHKYFIRNSRYPSAIRLAWDTSFVTERILVITVLYYIIKCNTLVAKVPIDTRATSWRKFLIETIQENKGSLLIARLLRSWRGKSLLDSTRWHNFVLWKIYRQWTKVWSYCCSMMTKILTDSWDNTKDLTL